MEGLHVESEDQEVKLGLKPKYLRQNLWSTESDARMVAYEWTETAEPLPRPPPSEYENLSALRTLEARPDLFKVISPIRVDVFERLLKDHPNQRFVSSVLEGLREGFWPWATTVREDYPVTHDETRPVNLTAEKESFLR